jgi:hypothetical protein
MRACLIIPCHEPKIPWLLDFLETLSNPENEKIVIAVSVGRDIDLFKKRLAQSPQYNNLFFLATADYLSSEGLHAGSKAIQCSASGIINIKKFAALMWSMRDYDYAVCVDADSKALSDLTTILKAAVTNYKKNIFFGSTTRDFSFYRMNNVNHRYFKPDQVAKIKQNTNDGHVYTWFHDVPTYKKEDLADFFAMMDENQGLDTFLERIDWYAFEHIAYQQFLIVAKNATIIDVEGKIPEEFPVAQHKAINKKYDYLPLWVPKSMYEADPAMQKLGFHMLNHMDR